MPQPKTKSRSKLYSGLAILAAIGLFAWSLAGLHVHEPAGPVSAAEAKDFTRIEIPPEATNIRIAGFHQWIQYEQFLRFEAPAEVCLRTARRVQPNVKLARCDEFDLKHVDSVRKDVYHDLTWFDLQQGVEVYGAGGGPGEPRLWVDTRRGVFYLKKTD
jgi:hypothetical protein